MRNYVVWLLMIQRLSGFKRGRFRARAAQRHGTLWPSRQLSFCPIWDTDGSPCEPTLSLLARPLPMLSRSIEQTPAGEHQSNHAEGAVERIRQLVGTILAELEDKLQIKIKTFDPLHHWCWHHAGWILQRFGVTQNLTPWERVHAAPYGGKLVGFAECVLARVKTATKGKPRWLRAMWLGKTDVSDCRLVCTSSGLLVVARSVRRTTCAYDPSLVGALRDTPDQHVSFLAGRVGASRNQLRPKPVENENLGSGSEALASDPPSENEHVIESPHDIAPAPSSARLPSPQLLLGNLPRPQRMCHRLRVLCQQVDRGSRKPQHQTLVWV